MCCSSSSSSKRRRLTDIFNAQGTGFRLFILIVSVANVTRVLPPLIVGDGTYREKIFIFQSVKNMYGYYTVHSNN
jgi:hypothetical protein